MPLDFYDQLVEILSMPRPRSHAAIHAHTAIAFTVISDTSRAQPKLKNVPIMIYSARRR